MSSYCTFAPFFFFFFYETIAKTRSFVNRFWYTAATIKKGLHDVIIIIIFYFLHIYYECTFAALARLLPALWYQCCPVITIYNIIILLFINNNNNMSHTCTMHIQTHTHTFIYYNIYYRRDKRCRRTRGVLVQCRPAAARTPTHTQTHSLGRHPTLTANRVIILLSTDFIVIILQYILYRRVYNNYCIRGL